VEAIALATTDSPIGPLTVAARGANVCLVHFGRISDYVQSALARWYPGAPIAPGGDPGGVVAVLTRDFDGDLAALDEVEVELHGTAFQQRVWLALRGVAAGTTTSYAELASRVGAPSAVRAVGAANGANPVAVVLPCHRIIGSNGSLTGYGGGLDRKRWLLDHEGVRPTLFGVRPRIVNSAVLRRVSGVRPWGRTTAAAASSTTVATRPPHRSPWAAPRSSPGTRRSTRTATAAAS
jgi:methylated-DNA-[protein]-cysteine S-methyltransferase